MPHPFTRWRRAQRPHMPMTNTQNALLRTRTTMTAILLSVSAIFSNLGTLLEHWLAQLKMESTHGIASADFCWPTRMPGTSPLMHWRRSTHGRLGAGSAYLREVASGLGSPYSVFGWRTDKLPDLMQSDVGLIRPPRLRASLPKPKSTTPR